MSELAPALKQQDGGGMAQGLDAGGMGSFGPPQQSHGAMADAGVAGAGGEIPHRAQMERSFGGQDFGGVRAHTGAAAANASRGLGAHAYAVGENVAFANDNPDPALVAHELTHVVQQRQGGGAGPQAKGGAEGIDKSGEGEAEAVESAVKGGKPATSALEGGVAKQGSAQLKSGKGIARSEHGGAPFTFGMSFSPESMEKTYEYKLWDSKFEVPIPAVPGLNFKIAPSVKVVGGAGVNWHHNAVEAKLGVLGNVQMGFSYGNGAIAEVYGVMEAKAEGGFNYKKLAGGGGAAHGAPAEHAPAAKPGEPEKMQAKSWELEGGIALSTNFRVGIELAGGWVDWGFDFGKCEIGKLTGISIKDGHLDKSATGWEWGPKPKEFFAAVNRAIAKAQELKKMGTEAFNAGMERAKKTGQSMYNAGAAAVDWISSW